MRHKLMVRRMSPGAILDYYELLKGQGAPCWYIRTGPQGHAISAVCPTPRAAWEDAANTLSRAAQIPPAPKSKRPRQRPPTNTMFTA